jgi:hypothetical protein
MAADGSTHVSWENRRRRVLELLEQRKYGLALEQIRLEDGIESQGHSFSLMGLAAYQLEQYTEAAGYYRSALDCNPNEADWRQMLTQAENNAAAQTNIHLPEFGCFDREKLLAPACTKADLPAALPPRKLIWAEKARRLFGNLLGTFASFFMETTIRSWGAIAGYRDEIWTNWYRRRLTFAILTLAYMRERLNKRNLKSAYAPGGLVGFQPEVGSPPEGAITFRTADGTWNNLKNPKEGAAGTRFMRNSSGAHIQAETGERLMTPNPREISRKLLTRNGPMPEIPFLNLLAASWIQFETQDWISHGEILRNDVFEIPLAADDPARRRYYQTKIFVGKTQPDPTRMPEEPVPVSFINEVTHWWDGSQIYGSDLETQLRLRSFSGGRMKLRSDGSLPPDSKGAEDTGFQRNWWVGVAILHTLFVREHNAICDHLAMFYPQWDDNRLFNVARLINAAVMAKIHTVEWTPAILPNPALNAALNANWFGLLTNFFEYGKHRLTLSEIKVPNPELGGVVGNPINKHGQAYGLTEEFTEVYRLHSLLPETVQVRKIGVDGIEEIPLAATRQMGSAKITEKLGVASLLYSFGLQHPGQLVLHNYPRFMQELSIPGNPLFDMGAVDILRARERGVPRYNEFRRQLGLKPIRFFEDLTDNEGHARQLKEVYGDQPANIEDLDLLIGTLAEGHRPTGFGFGETLFQIFILNATRRLQADRFYTDNYNEATYTKEGLDWIDSNSFKTVLLRNYPELARTGLSNVSNAFEPWDTQKQLEPMRHPLRAYDRELESDPWLGDSYRG